MDNQKYSEFIRNSGDKALLFLYNSLVIEKNEMGARPLGYLQSKLEIVEAEILRRMGRTV